MQVVLPGIAQQGWQMKVVYPDRIPYLSHDRPYGILSNREDPVLGPQRFLLQVILQPVGHLLRYEDGLLNRK
jgi:hypothetical protein